MFTVFLAVCLAGMPVQECQRESALDWIAAPERQPHLGGCLIHGQQYAAQSRLVTEGTYLKVFCRAPGGRPDIG